MFVLPTRESGRIEIILSVSRIQSVSQPVRQAGRLAFGYLMAHVEKSASERILHE